MQLRLRFGIFTVGLGLAFAPVSACSSGNSSSQGVGGNPGSGATTGSGGTSGTGGRVTGGTTGSGGIVGAGGAACRSNADCGHPGMLYCAPAGSSPGCGTCPSPNSGYPTCTTDADCNPDGGTRICEGACNGACPTKICVGGCVDDTSCAEGTHCDATHRCTALACTGDGGCPSNFRCSNSLCTRRTCTSDAQCPKYCVSNQCYSSLGVCLAPAA